MKLTKSQIERMVRKVFDELKTAQLATFKEPEEKCFRVAVAYVEEEFAEEAELDREVNKMLDQLESENPNQFQRGKMFGMLKKKLAKEKGFVL